MKPTVLVCLACVAVAACSNMDNVMAPGAASRQPRFENGGMAGSGGRSTTPPSDSINSVTGASLAGDDEDARNDGGVFGGSGNRAGGVGLGPGGYVPTPPSGMADETMTATDSTSSGRGGLGLGSGH